MAHLARFQLDGGEIGRYAEQLENILAYVGKLSQLKTDGVPVTAQVTGLFNVARTDDASAVNPAVRDRLLKAAPERSGDFIQTTGVFA